MANRQYAGFAPSTEATSSSSLGILARPDMVYKGKAPLEGGLALDRKNRTVMKGGETVELTDLEVNILDYLLKKRGCAVSVRELYENVWDEKFLSSSTNTVMVHILNLRKKIEDDAANPKIIRTVWGKGYQIDE